jgi:hypothetical protein
VRPDAKFVAGFDAVFAAEVRAVRRDRPDRVPGLAAHLELRHLEPGNGSEVGHLQATTDMASARQV